MKKYLFFALVLLGACSPPRSNNPQAVLVPGIPTEMPRIQDACKPDMAAFPQMVEVEYMNDTVCLSPLPDGVSATVSGAHVALHSSRGDVEYLLKGMSGCGSFGLHSDSPAVVSMASLKLFSQKNTTVGVKAPMAYLRGMDSAPVYIMDGIPSDTVVSPKNAAALQVDGNAVVFGGNIALRGERRHAVQCSGRLLIDGAALSVENARENGVSADSGVVVTKTASLLVCSAKDAVRSKRGDAVFLGGTVSLKSTGRKGDGVQARNVLLYGGNITADVSGEASRGINAKKSVYIMDGMLTVNACGGAVYSPKKTDYSSGACIKSGEHFYLNEGYVALTNSGDAGKGINCNGLLQIDGGTLLVTTTGNDVLHPDESTAHASAKGVKCDSTVLINGGLIEILVFGKGDRCEGLESKHDMTVRGENTTIYIYATDDAVNAGGNLCVEGGRLYAYSEYNDGIDGNGRIALCGGLVVANGCGSPEQGLDVDADSRFSVTGGTLVTVGGAMGARPAMPRSAESTQPVVAWSGNGMVRGRYIAVSASDGRLLCAYRVPRTLRDGVFLYSSPLLETSRSYTIAECDTVEGARHIGNGFYVDGNAPASEGIAWKQERLFAALTKEGAVSFLDADTVDFRPGMMPPPPAPGGQGGAFPPPPGNGFPPPAPDGNMPPPPPGFDGMAGTGFMPPPPQGGFMPPRINGEGYGSGNLPGGGWLPGSWK